jgi:serine/threonine-protein kinase Stk1
VRQALEAIAHIHAHEMVHGDVKPANLILGTEGIRLFDFGLSCTTNTQPGTLPRLQRHRLAAWTPSYAALELLEGGPATCATDIYALACVIYELVSGQHPYRHCNARQAQQQRLDRVLSCPAQLPRHSWRALKQALSLNTAGTRITAEELLAAFRSDEARRWPRWMCPWRAPP